MSISRITPGQISFIASMDSRIRLNLRKRNSSRSQGIGSAWPLRLWLTSCGFRVGGAAARLRLRALDRDVLERRRIGEAGDLAERGLAHPRADTVEEGEFPDRRIDRLLADQPLHLFEDRRPLLRVEFVGLQWEEFVDVGIAAID